MSATTKLAFLLCLCISGTGCETQSGSTRSTFSNLGVIQIRDIQQANVCRENLPTFLGLPKRQVEIEPGSGITVVTIERGKDSRSKDDFVKKVQEYVNQSGQGPIKLRVYPEDSMIWSKATIIEKQL